MPWNKTAFETSAINIIWKQREKTFLLFQQWFKLCILNKLLILYNNLFDVWLQNRRFRNISYTADSKPVLKYSKSAADNFENISVKKKGKPFKLKVELLKKAENTVSNFFFCNNVSKNHLLKTRQKVTCTCGKC